MLAITLTAPPQCSQVSISILNTRFNRWAHVIATCRAGGGSPVDSVVRRPRLLRGKHKPEFTPSFDTGDYIIVLNAGKVRVTGNKLHDKFYHDHSGYPGGMKSKSFEKLNERHPGEALARAVKGMLPKGPLGRAMFRKMKVYTGAEHNHAAQQPQPLEI